MTLFTPSSSTNTMSPSQKTSKIDRHEFPLVKPCWLLPTTFSFFIVSRMICPMIFPGTEVRLNSYCFPQSSLFSFLKMRVMFLLFLSVGTSLYCHDFSNMMDSYLATSSTGSFWIRGYISSGTMDASHQLLRTCVPSDFLNYLRPGLHLQWKVLIHFPSPCLAFCNLGSVAGAIAGKD